jgi:hypothetical protein
MVKFSLRHTLDALKSRYIWLRVKGLDPCFCKQQDIRTGQHMHDVSASMQDIQLALNVPCQKLDVNPCKGRYYRLMLYSTPSMVMPPPHITCLWDTPSLVLSHTHNTAL